MLFVFAAVGVITVAVLLWRAFGVPTEETAPRSGGGTRRMSAPDDDPEFLRSLDKRNREEGDR
jgi:hypothetical protein